jgi:hypothetical protein
MAESSPKTLARKLCLLSLLICALVVALSSANTPKARACQTCLEETRAAYIYCRDHPDDMYYGCNFSTTCDGGTRTANQIYRDECCDMPVRDGGWTIYCL